MDGQRWIGAGASVQSMAITAVTRRALLADMRDAKVWWSGDCNNDVEFLDRLYDVDDLSSADPA